MSLVFMLPWARLSGLETKVQTEMAAESKMLEKYNQKGY